MSQSDQEDLNLSAEEGTKVIAAIITRLQLQQNLYSKLLPPEVRAVLGQIIHKDVIDLYTLLAAGLPHDKINRLCGFDAEAFKREMYPYLQAERKGKWDTRAAEDIISSGE